MRGIGVAWVASEIGNIDDTNYTTTKHVLIERLKYRFGGTRKEAEYSLEVAVRVGAVVCDGEDVRLVIDNVGCQKGHK
jgi:hypothetical protein